MTQPAGLSQGKTWTVATLKGNFQPPPGYAGPPPEYTIKALQAALHIHGFYIVPTQRKPKLVSYGMCGRPGGVLNIHYIASGDGKEYHITVIETGVPGSWYYEHQPLEIPAPEAFEWTMEGSYVAIPAGLAYDKIPGKR